MYRGYNKIPLTSSEWKNFNPKNVKYWYITEKVHGSCFCFIFNCKTKEITFGKRKGILYDEETFFGYRTILPLLLDKIQMIGEMVLSKYIDTIKIHIYGELFGNGVQNGIYYSETIHYYAFDISYINLSMDEIYLNFEESLNIFNKVDILHAKPLAKFTNLSQAMDYNYNFQSTIPKQLGNEIKDDNKAEGIVIRSSHGRFLVKKKIEEFTESKYQENDYQNDNISPLEQYKRLALKCLTQNRLNNAISKYGEFDKYKEQILEELCMDILSEINGFHHYELKDWLDAEILKFILEPLN